MNVLFAILILPFVLVSSKNSYIVTVPKVIRPGSVANVCVHIIKNRINSATITASLLTPDNKTISTVVKQVRPRVAEVLKLQVPQNVQASFEYKIRVAGSGGISFQKTAIRIEVASKATSLFIQTDRPVYKPGDLVRFRVVGIHPNLLTVKEPMDIVVYDPKQNRLKQFLGVKQDFDVFAGDLQLSTLTTHGSWRIEVKQLGKRMSQNFEVKEYVLPKFEVNIIIPPLQLTTDEYFRFTVTAIYTFGKPVFGEVEVTIGYTFSSDKITKKFKINGKADINILMREIQPRLGRYIPIFANVTETITGNIANASANARIYDYQEKMSFSSNLPSIFKPGLQYTYVLRVTKMDDSLLDPPAGEVNITVYYSVYRKTSTNPTFVDEFQEMRKFDTRCPSLPPTDEKMLYSKQIVIPPNGILSQDVLLPKDAVRARIVAYYRKTSSYLYLQRAGSTSNSFIQVRIKDEAKAEPDKTLELILTGTENVLLCYYKVFSKGSLIVQGRFTSCLTGSNTSNKRIRITATMAPTALFLIYYVRPSGEIVADSISFPISEMFENKVAIKFNKDRVLPAETVKLEITADPNSLVNVLSVDKSILLIATSNDITVEKVLNELQMYSSRGTFWSFSSWDWWWPRPFDGKDAFDVFDLAGIYVLTDANLYQYVESASGVEFDDARFDDVARLSGLPGPPGAPGAPGRPGRPLALAGSAGSTSLPEPTRTRTNFPETWLWENVTTGSSGRASISATAPDTITEWITSAFAVNPRSGLGVATELANLTTFQRFFLRLELPYSVIRGEILILQVTIFNYMSQDLEVFVKLNKSVNFKFSDNNGHEISSNGDGLIKSIYVKKDGISAVYFPIIASTVGKIKLQVTAKSTIIADAVEQELLIEAEGIKQNYNIPLLIDLRQQRSFKSDVTIDFPPNVLRDSEFIKISVIGDVLATTLTGLENLLSISYGCGEQNMLQFSPNVYVGSYLKVTNRLTPEIEAKIKNLLSQGYQRELTYMRNDGSFSAFGDSDKSGSTWLTAFVVKSFAQASNLTYIDPGVMRKSITFLINQQQEAGEFLEPGIVYHKEMQGGSSSSNRSLAAFVLIALLESKNNLQIPSVISVQVNQAIDRTINYISNGAPATLNNLYELVIVLYALTLANHHSVDAILTVLEQKAVIKGDEKYWTLPDTDANIIKPWRSWSPPTTNARALDIEMTSYALLVYNLKGDTLNGFKVLQWLSRQRNSNGGFISTQDTVVALQALGGLAVKLYSPTFNIDVQVSGNQWAGRTFEVNTVNSLVLQIEDVPKTIRQISVDATGTGFCLMQTAVYYNVPAELREPSFDLTISVLRDSINGFRLRICFRWLRSGQSTMGYLEISIPTGMAADLSSLNTDETGGLFKRIEPAFRQVNLFFDWITTKTMCVELNMNRVALVARHQPVPVRLSEYYEQSNEVIKLYSSTILSNATIFEVCGQNGCEEVKR